MVTLITIWDRNYNSLCEYEEEFASVNEMVKFAKDYFKDEPVYALGYSENSEIREVIV